MGLWPEAVFVYSLFNFGAKYWLANATPQPPTLQKRDAVLIV